MAERESDSWFVGALRRLRQRHRRGEIPILQMNVRDGMNGN